MGDAVSIADDHDPLGHVIEDDDSPRKVCPRFADDRFAAGIDERKFQRVRHARKSLDLLLKDFRHFAHHWIERVLDEEAQSEFYSDLDKLEDAHFGEIDRQLEAAEKLP